MRKYIIILTMFLSMQVSAESRTKREVVQEYPQVKLTVVDLKEDVRGFLKIPIWSISYKVDNPELASLKMMNTQKCDEVPKIIKNGQTYQVTVKKIKKTEDNRVEYYYNINPRQLGIPCPYSWEDM